LHFLAISRLALFLFMEGLTATVALGNGISPDCRWIGPSPEKLMAMHLSSGQISGALGSEVIPFLQRNGIPVSFVSGLGGDPKVTLEISASTMLREVLDEVVHQAPDYRYAVVESRLLVYPRSAVYDAPVDVTPLEGALRASAVYAVLRELRAKSTPFQKLEIPMLPGAGMGWGKNLYSDVLDVGGARSAVEHLASLLGKRPSLTFRVLAEKDGSLSFSFNRVPLVRKLAVHAPATVGVGSTFNVVVTGTLSDGTEVSLDGPGCLVNYGASGGGILEIDEEGRVVARKKGIGSIAVQYEDQSANAQVTVHEK
jgi:hypothetical protein